MSQDYFLPYATASAAASQTMSLGEELSYGAFAAVVDAGASTYNSVGNIVEFFGGSIGEASTEDMLRATSQNALSVYRQNADTVQLASLIGGALVPGLLGLKATNMARKIKGAPDFFSDEGKRKSLQAVQDAFANSGPGANSTLNSLKSRYYARDLANQALDTTAMELAIVAGLSAHPLMEEYFKDFGSNFATSVAIGLAPAGVFGHILARQELKGIAATQESPFSKVFSQAVREPESLESVTSEITRRNLNSENLYAAFNSTDIPPYMKEAIQLEAQHQAAEGIRAAESKLFKGEILAKDLTSYRHELVKKIAKDTRFLGASTAALATSADIASAITSGTKGVVEPKDWLGRKLATPDEVASSTFYSPYHNAFLDSTELRNFTTAADHSSYSLNFKPGVAAREDFPTLLTTKSTGELQADYIKILLAYSGKSSKDLTTSPPVVSYTDLNSLSALHSHYQGLRASDGADLPSLDKLALILHKPDSPLPTIVPMSTIPEILGSQILPLVKQDFAAGTALETIALKYNLTKESVAKLAADGLKKEHLTYGLQTVEEVMKAGEATSRLLKFTMDPKFKPIDPKVSMQQRGIETATSELLDLKLKGSASPLIRKLASFIVSPEGKFSTNFLRNNLHEITPSKVGNSLFGSVDFSLRRLGPMGEVIVSSGRRARDAMNLASLEITKAIASSLEGVISKGTPHILEINNALNLRGASQNATIFRNGQFWDLKKEQASKIIGMDDAGFQSLVLQARVQPLKNSDGSDFRVATPEVAASLELLQTKGRELLELHNLVRNIKGLPPLNDKGFWVPPVNFRNKQSAFAINRNTGQITAILGRDAADLNTQVEAFKRISPDHDVVKRGDDLKDYNTLKGRYDPMTMDIADSSLLRTGSSASPLPSTSSEPLAEIAMGYDFYVENAVEQMVKLQNADAFGYFNMLNRLAEVGYDANSLSRLTKMVSSPARPGDSLANILLGKSKLSEHAWWDDGQVGFIAAADRMLNKVSSITHSLKPGKSSEKEWEEALDKMKSLGIQDPFAAYGNQVGLQAYIREQGIQTPKHTARLLALGQGLAATVVLRFMEVSHALTNVLSLPILTSSATHKFLQENYLGSKVDAAGAVSKGIFHTPQMMFEGVRLMNHRTEGEKWHKLAEEAGLFKEDWRAVNGLLRQIHSLEPGITPKLEKALESKFVEITSMPADYSERIVRQVSFFTGVNMAKKYYKDLPDAAVMVFARNFMNEAIGNYTANQRPAIFQGTMGMALGLFQTYMVTLAQNIYKNVEGRNFKVLASMALAQTGIFGASSLPAFSQISEIIGSNFSDENYDLTTGTFRALPDQAAEILLYGAPSQAIGLTTRGDIQPRLPNPVEGLSSLPLYQITASSLELGGNLVKAVAKAGQGDGGIAMLEALSLQSLSRPVARWADIVQGKSITQSGDIVAGQEDFDFPTLAAFSRLFGARPIEEIRAREAIHLRSIYNKANSEDTRKVIRELKGLIEADELTSERYSSLMEKYLRSGSMEGWKAAVEDAQVQAVNSGGVNVSMTLDADSPLQRLVGDVW